jgi:hypothetical protein
MILITLLSLLLYFFIVFLLFFIKPSIFFENNGNLKHYNFNSPYITLELIIPIIAILCYFIIMVLYIMVN